MRMDPDAIGAPRMLGLGRPALSHADEQAAEDDRPEEDQELPASMQDFSPVSGRA